MWSFQNSTTLAVKDAIHLDDLITVATAALVGYDYVLTVSRELRLFWKGSINVASILYFTNRYLAVLYYVGLAYYRRLVLPFPVCQVQNYFNIGIRYLQYLPWAVFSALRVYALSRKHWGLSGVTFFSLVLALALNYYGNFHHRSFYTDSTITSGCVTAATTPTVLSLVVVITGGQIIGDAIAMGITWKATYHARRDSSLSFLTRVMFRNGKSTSVQRI
ncbi:hypothetical protein BD310DRAFT_953487 [Dichomitus squalens]|uniref:DUF6533 domain-containing protein n=1 Tax=Dichomitus squalens TaxID=114155 RepID=A0A4Q9QEN7_9APHY|nr:hypothetical protein BD310DRAFT_953487 [Dichomitus squalens]